jgi:hypothetical protein
MSATSTQENIAIAGIKDGIAILKNGEYRLILSVGAVNFDLKSEQEQNALVFQYQSFLNSLHFPIEICIQSKKLDLSPYLSKIKGLAQKQNNELLRIQTEDYAEFVAQLINMANIMKKTFYVVIGYVPINVGQGGILGKLFKKSDTSTVKVSEDTFLEHSKELRQRAETIASGLASMGLHCKQLTTQEVIELFYNVYNPEVAGKERLVSTGDVSSSFVASESEKAPDDKPNTDEEEKVIDNTSMVQAEMEKQQQEKKQESDKMSERDIAMSPPQPSTPHSTNDAKKDDDASPLRPFGPPQNPQPPTQAATSPAPAQNVAPAPTNAAKNVPPEPLATAGLTKEEKQQVTDPNINQDYGW